MLGIASDGAIAWRRKISGNLHTLSGAVAYFDKDETLHALNLSTGSIRWSFKINEETNIGDVAVAGGKVYVIASRYPEPEEQIDGEKFVRLYALDANSGAEEWFFEEVPGKRNYNWTVHATPTTCFVLYDHGSFVAVSSGGVRRWETTLSGTNIVADLGPVRDGTLYVASEQTGLVAISTDTGSVRWSRSGFELVHGFEDGTVIGSAENVRNHVRFAAFDARTGRERWRTDIEGIAAHNPGIIRNGVLYSTTIWKTVDKEKVRLHGIDATMGCSLGSATMRSKRVTNPVEAGNRVYFGLGRPDSTLLAVAPVM